MPSERIKDLITSPFTVVASVVGSVLAIDPTFPITLGAVVWAQAGTLFTAVSISAFTVVPNVPWLAPLEHYFVAAALGFAGVYITKLVYQFWGSVKSKS